MSDYNTSFFGGEKTLNFIKLSKKYPNPKPVSCLRACECVNKSKFACML